MARSAKRSGKKRRAKIHFNTNTRKNKWKKEKKSRQHVACPQIQKEWDAKQSAKSNLESIGLAYDINKIMKPPSTKEQLKKLATGGEEKEDVIMKEVAEVEAKTKVARDLEAEASAATEEAKKRKALRLSQPEIRYCIYMIEKYGEDYEKMARDRKNVFQDTPAQIRRKLDTFKSIPIQYNAYLRSKGLLTEDAPMDL